MKLADLDDGDQLTRTITTLEELLKHLATKAELAQLKADIMERLLEMQSRMYQLIFGTYALIVVGVFINHFWR